MADQTNHIIRYNFYTENIYDKLVCKAKDRVVVEDKDNIVYQRDYGNCKAVYFSEFKRFLKLSSDEHNRSVKNCDCENNKIGKHFWEDDQNLSWDEKKVVDRKNRLIPKKKIKENYYFNNSNPMY